MSVNVVVISGNLTRDPERRELRSGTAVLNFGMAVNDRRQDPQTGNWEDYPNFVDCALFGRRADSLADILRRGMQVTVRGRLRYSSWEKDGERRSKLEVVAEEVVLPPRGASANPQSQVQGYAPQVAQQHAYAAPQPVAPAPQPAYPAPAPQANPQSQVQGYVPQQQLGGMPPVQQPQPPTMDVYDEDIPF